MCPFDDPPPRSDARLGLQLLLLLAPTSHMKREARCNSYSTGLVVAVSLVETESLGRCSGRSSARHRDTFDRLGHQFVVVPIRAVNGEPDGNARAIGEEAALGSVLAAIGGVGSRLFPPRVEPSSSPRPSRASSNRSPSHRRRPVAPAARTREKRRCRATRGISCVLTSRNKFPSHPRNSIGSRCGARTGWRTSHCDRELAACGTQVGVAAVVATTVPSLPKARQSTSNWRYAKSVP